MGLALPKQFIRQYFIAARLTHMIIIVTNA